MRRFILVVAFAAGLIAAPTAAFAQVSPTTGHKGAPDNTCGNPGATSTPGNAGSAPGSPFNPNGNAGLHYAGNDGTASLAHSNSTASVSQYDIACFNVTK